MKWIKLEDQLPPKHTLVLVRRHPNKLENEPVYLAMRQDKPLSTNEDPSMDCYWHGNHVREIFSEQEYACELDSFSNFSDVTVKEWSFVELKNIEYDLYN